MSAERFPVTAEGVSVSFGDRVALEDVSFSLPAGSFTAVLGPNGAGKTTLLRALLGEIGIAGRVTVAPPVAYVPQLSDARAAFPITALGVVVMGFYPRLGWWRRPSRADRARALDLLERVGLADRARSSFDELSGGQRQRVVLARALAQDGRVLLLDEPLSGIDTLSRFLMLDVIRQQCDDGRTVMMTTHDLSEAARVCDRMLVLNRRLLAAGTTAETFTEEVLRRAYGAGIVMLNGHAAVLDDPHHRHHGEKEGRPWAG